MGIAIAGREHFVDGDKDRKTALGTTTGFTECFLEDFSEEQVAIYLRHKGLIGRLPAWLPARPLLLAHLASRRAPHNLIIGGSILEDMANADERKKYLMDKPVKFRFLSNSGCTAVAGIDDVEEF